VLDPLINASRDEPCLLDPRRVPGSTDLVLEDNVQSVDDTRDVAQNREDDVEEQVRVAATLEEYTQGGQDNGKDDLAQIACGDSHFCSGSWEALLVRLL
jgi:hypothetical protein